MEAGSLQHDYIQHYYILHGFLGKGQKCSKREGEKESKLHYQATPLPQVKDQHGDAQSYPPLPFGEPWSSGPVFAMESQQGAKPPTPETRVPGLSPGPCLLTELRAPDTPSPRNSFFASLAGSASFGEPRLQIAHSALLSISTHRTNHPCSGRQLDTSFAGSELFHCGGSHRNTCEQGNPSAQRAPPHTHKPLAPLEEPRPLFPHLIAPRPLTTPHPPPATLRFLPLLAE